MPPHDPLAGASPSSLDAQSAEARWRLVFDASGDGVWDWDIENDRVIFSDKLKQMLGFDPGVPWCTVRDWSERVHPDDLPGTMAAVQDHLDGRTASYANEHRLLCADGSWKWVLDRGMVLTRDADGRPLRMVGSHTDLSAIRQAREALDQQRQLFGTVLKSAPVGIAVYNATSGQALYVNRRFEEFFEAPPGSLANRHDALDILFIDPVERADVDRRVSADLAQAPDAEHSVDAPVHGALGRAALAVHPPGPAARARPRRHHRRERHRDAPCRRFPSPAGGAAAAA